MIMIEFDIVRTYFHLVLKIFESCSIFHLQYCAIWENNETNCNMTHKTKLEKLDCFERQKMVERWSKAIMFYQKGLVDNVKNKKVKTCNWIENRHSRWISQNSPESSKLLCIHEESIYLFTCIKSLKVILNHFWSSTPIWFIINISLFIMNLIFPSSIFTSIYKCQNWHSDLRHLRWNCIDKKGKC